MFDLYYAEWEEFDIREKTLQNVRNNRKPEHASKVNMTVDSWALVYIENEQDLSRGMLCQLWVPWVFWEIQEVIEFERVGRPAFIGAMPPTAVVDLDLMGMPRW